ncbi:MAG TPA: hypothetical protein VMH32_03570 [Burkholderiales bacterium]|nr:hypothetical protein [Burkholderiales bacterium]
MRAFHHAAAVLLCAAVLLGCGQNVLNAPRPAPYVDLPRLRGSDRIELQLERGKPNANPDTDTAEKLEPWIGRAADAVSAYYGQFPVAQTRMLVEQTDGNGVQWARTFARSGFVVRVGMGKQTSASQLASDWMLTHEFVHLALPTLPDEHDWLQEGAATYVEPVARAQAGQLTPEQVWAEFAHGMSRGLPGPRDRGLDNTSSWPRTYWGGAMFCLVADIEIRKQTANRYGLRDALRGILAAGGTLDHRWSIRETLVAGDRAVGVPVLTQMYDQWRAAPVQVDLEALWHQLGVQREGRVVVLDDTAPLADVRRAITAQPVTAAADDDPSSPLQAD